MSKRRGYKRRRAFKLKLKSGTIYSIFSFGLLAVGVLLFLSFFSSGESFDFVRAILSEQFGSLGALFPFVVVFFAFLFLRLRMFISRLNVSVGFLLFFISAITLTKSGVIGLGIFITLAEIVTRIGATLIAFVGILVGIIVFFDTSVDEMLSATKFLGKNIHRIFPVNIFSLFKSKSTLSVQKMTIKEGNREIANIGQPKQAVAPSPMIVKKDPILLSEKLVSNPLKGSIWEYPPLSLLADSPNRKADRGDIKRIAAVIEKTLQSFGIEARVVEVNLGPAVTQYALEIALGTKVSKITSLSNDLALATEAPTGQIRIEAPIPGRSLVGIEIPNRSLEIVTLKTMLASSVMQKSASRLTVSLGLDVSGAPVVANLSKMPHVLVAGTTGSGKSVLINAFISSLLFRASPQEVKLILVDPKRVEFTAYNGIPHLLTPVIVEPEKILSALKWAMGEMDRRYKLFAERAVRNIDSYNELSGFQALPYIVIIIDELADLMMFAPVEVEDAIARLAQMARATGIHLVIATQRPSVNVITGLIKANIPCRIAFNVASLTDSRVIIDTPGAEKLLGRGDMLYVPPDQAKPSRIQGAYVSEPEIKKLVSYLKAKSPLVEYTEEITSQKVLVKKGMGMSTGPIDERDPFLEDAIRSVCQYDRASASLLQRRLKVGYARAARILDELESMGVVGPGEGSKPRDVLVQDPEGFIANLHQPQQ